MLSFSRKIYTIKKRTIITTKTSLRVNNQSNRKECYLISCSKGNLANQLWEYISLYVVWQRFREYNHIPYIEESMLNNLQFLLSNLTIRTASHINVSILCSEEKGKWIIPKTRPLDKYENWFRDKAPCRDIFLDQYSTRYEDILAYQVEKIKKEMKLSNMTVSTFNHDESTQAASIFVLPYNTQELWGKWKSGAWRKYRDGLLSMWRGLTLMKWQFLRFHKHLVKEAQIKLSKLALYFDVPVGNATFVGIHYRGGDYVDYLRMRYQINSQDLPDYRYYVKAMRYLKEKYKHIIFILITIDMVWLVKNQHFIENEGNVVVNPYNQMDRINDLVLLSNCNHSIINYGTFGVTTAFFAGGTIYVYRLNLPLDYRGATVALGFANKLEKWHAIF